MYLVRTIGDLGAAVPTAPTPVVDEAPSSTDASVIVGAAVGGALLALVGVFAWSRLGGKRR